MHNAGFASETPNDPSGALASCRRRPYVIDEQLHIYDLYFVYFMVPYNFRVQRTHTRDLRLISINCWVVRGCRISHMVSGIHGCTCCPILRGYFVCDARVQNLRMHVYILKPANWSHLSITNVNT